MGAWALRARTLLVMGLALFPGVAAAQSTISGVVTDASGAVLPGVSVEASSPALIEKTRSRDDRRSGSLHHRRHPAGRLFGHVHPPGVHRGQPRRDPGRRECHGSAQCGAESGSVAETITVTGATPMVDVQQAAQRQVLGREQLDTLPTARSFLSTGVVVPTAKISRPDMGGIQVGQASYLSARGRSSNDNAVEVDGLDVRISNGVSQSGYNNFAMVQDVTYQTSAIGADSAAGGVRINMIPRDGGNTFAGDFFVGGSFNGWQADNLTPELRARGPADARRARVPRRGHAGIRRADSQGQAVVLRVRQVQRGEGAPGWRHFLRDRRAWIHDQRPAQSLGARDVAGQPAEQVYGYIDQWFKSQDHTITFTAGEGCPPGVDWETATSTYPAHNSFSAMGNGRRR